MASSSMRRRAVVYSFTLWVVLTLNFMLPRLLPGDPLLSLVDPSDATLYDAQTLQQLAAYHGLDRPLPEQYVRYWQNLLRGDLGESISFKQSVISIIAGRLPWTLALVLPSLFISSAIALVAGAQAGWKRGTFVDRGLTVLFLLLWNLPAFFIGFLLLMLFAVQLRWLPLSGALTRFAHYDSPTAQLLDIASHWLLPATTLILSTIGGRFLLMRNTMVNVLGQDYVLVAHAKGLPIRTVQYRHALRNALLPFFTVFTTQIGLAVTGATIIETLFAYPGMGLLLLEAVNSRDYPLIQGAFLVISLTVLSVNFLAEMLAHKVDPRVA